MNEETPEVTAALDSANVYATHKTIGSQGLSLAIITYYIDAIYKLAITSAEMGFTTAQAWKLVVICIAFATQLIIGMIGFILLRRKRDVKLRKGCRSSTLNDMSMILSFLILIFNVAIERIA